MDSRRRVLEVDEGQVASLGPEGFGRRSFLGAHRDMGHVEGQAQLRELLAELVILGQGLNPVARLRLEGDGDLKGLRQLAHLAQALDEEAPSVVWVDVGVAGAGREVHDLGSQLSSDLDGAAEEIDSAHAPEGIAVSQVGAVLAAWI